MSTRLDPRMLPTIPLFQGLTNDQLAQLYGLLQHVTVPARTNIIFLDQPGHTIYILITGTVKVQIEQEDGSNVVLAIRGPGDVLGEMSLADSLDRSATVTTLERSFFLCVAYQQFQTCLRDMPIMYENLLRILV